MAPFIDRPDEKSKHKPLTRQEMEKLSTELRGTPLGEQLKQIAEWQKMLDEGGPIMDLIIPTVYKRTNGETITYHVISAAWNTDRDVWRIRESEAIYNADGSLISRSRDREAPLKGRTERSQKGTSPKIPANSDLEKYMATHPDAKVQRLRFTYTVIDAGADGEIVIFDLNGKRYKQPTQQRTSVTYEPGTYEPADVSKIPVDSDLGKILGEYPDAKVMIHTRKGIRSYTATWGTYRWGGPKFMGNFDMSGHQIQSYQFKSAAFKSGQAKVQDKKPKKEKAAADILATYQERD